MRRLQESSSSSEPDHESESESDHRVRIRKEPIEVLDISGRLVGKAPWGRKIEAQKHLALSPMHHHQDALILGSAQIADITTSRDNATLVKSSFCKLSLCVQKNSNDVKMDCAVSRYWPGLPGSEIHEYKIELDDPESPS